MPLGQLGQYGLNGAGGGGGAAFPGTPTVTATAGGTTTLTSANGAGQIFTGTQNQTVVLPAATGSGKIFSIKNTSSAQIFVQRAGTDTIDGAVQVTLATNQAVDVYDSAAGKWVIL